MKDAGQLNLNNMNVHIHQKEKNTNLAAQCSAANTLQADNCAVQLKDNRQSSVMQKKQVDALNNIHPALSLAQQKKDSPAIQFKIMPKAEAGLRYSPLKQNNISPVQMVGWTSLGYLNPRRYIPEIVGGYTKEQMEEPQTRLQGGPLTLLGPLNPRKYIPKRLGGYTPEQMREPQNYQTGPLNLLGAANPRKYLPRVLGGYSQAQMLENWRAGNKRTAVGGANPLAGLRQQDWWRLFIDKPLHKDAEAGPGGMLFDRQQSPGYYQSMMGAFKKAIIDDRGKKVDYERYTEYHDLVSKHIASKKTFSDMRKLGGKEDFSMFGNPGPKDEADIRERAAALAEMKEERIQGRPLIAGFDKEARGQESQPNAIALHYDKGEGKHDIMTRYSATEGRTLVNEILKRHYDGGHKDGSDEKLASIAKTIRALHVGHFFGDGNGRHNIFLMMNKLLVDGGFKPSILPHGPAVFGGLKTIRGLTKDMKDGMEAFDQLKEGRGPELKEEEKKREKED